MTLGEKIKHLRARINMTQLELSELIGVTLRSVKYYEKNERYPEDEVINKIAAILDTTVSFLKDDAKDIEFTKQELFLQAAKEQYGTKGANDVKKTLENVRGLLYDNDLSNESKEAFLSVIEELYFESKDIAKKYGREKTDEN